MDVRTFSRGLLQALAGTGLFERVSLQTEGPTTSGYAFVQEGCFLRFYYNSVTGTIAFALIENQQRIWGVDYDNRRGWHLHPVDNPSDHIKISPLQISDIIIQLERVLRGAIIDVVDH